MIPVTVTVCGVSQLDAVKVNVARSSVASPVLLDAKSKLTSATGSVLNTTVNVAVPFSFTSNVVDDKAKLGTSLSVMFAMACATVPTEPMLTASIVTIMVSVVSTIASSVNGMLTVTLLLLSAIA